MVRIGCTARACRRLEARKLFAASAKETPGLLTRLGTRGAKSPPPTGVRTAYSESVKLYEVECLKAGTGWAASSRKLLQRGTYESAKCSGARLKWVLRREQG